MTFDPVEYERGYWCGRSGYPCVFSLASVRVGYQHGSVDRALDSVEVTGDLRTRLQAVSVVHSTWRAGAIACDREAQASANANSNTLMMTLVGETLLENISPALWARVHLLPGINLVF